MSSVRCLQLLHVSSIKFMFVWKTKYCERMDQTNRDAEGGCWCEKKFLEDTGEEMNKSGLHMWNGLKGKRLFK